ncbi:MAG: hypothetical protein LUM44_18065 [Pyrinomonadaceae bacterium]|nr:hypothetical protein [Pyrinomonadaceae bacterium]
MFERMLDKIPEWIQVGGVILLVILVPAVFIYFTTEYEGIASILFLIAGAAFYKTSQRKLVVEDYRFAVGFIILFAFLGLIFDGAGNFLYNKPIENLCPPQNELARDVKYVENYDGEDSILHQFSCFSSAENKIVYEIPRWKTLGIRFLEYIFLGAVFVVFYRVLSNLKTSKKT